MGHRESFEKDVFLNSARLSNPTINVMVISGDYFLLGINPPSKFLYTVK